MFNHIKKLTTSKAVVDIEAAIYVFHEPPIEGQRMMRATAAAYLLRTGELFVGCSCASEGDQFTREKGRAQALAESEAKLLKWLHKSPKIMPDAIIKIEDNTDGIFTRENKTVMFECLQYVLERFRLILASRYAIIQELNKELDAMTLAFVANKYE